MKTIRLIAGVNGAPSSIDILKVAAEHPGASGITYKDMAKRVRILDTLEKTATDAVTLELEDADWLLLCSLLEVCPFSRIHPSIIATAENLQQATA